MSTKKDVFLESKFLMGYYPKAMKVNGEGRELKFINGRTAVTQEEFEILKEHEKYGQEFALVGTLGARAVARQVDVIRGKSPLETLKAQLEADKRPKPALQPDEVAETAEEELTRLAAESAETNTVRGKIGSETQTKRAKRTAAP